MKPPLSRVGRERRRFTAAGLLGSFALLHGNPAQAGAQVEEPLADAVRSALGAAVAETAPPRPSFDSIEPRLDYLRWLGDMSHRLKNRKTEPSTRLEFLQTLWYESKRAGLQPALASITPPPRGCVR